MPRRTDINTILIIGSGPIVIGQGCEFDYSGVQACRALREEGYRVVLINSNPATIMTDPEFADATYIEPITPEAVEKILARESKGSHPIDAVLPTLGGQTGLNTAVACYDTGIFTKYGVQMIGANREAIYRGEDRQVFKDLMLKIGLKVPKSGVVHNMEDARKVMQEIGLPLIIRPAFTLGGTGGGIAYNVEEFETIVQRGIDASPVHEVLIEQSVIGWKEYELEVMRDRKDNVVIICSIENMDPMGVHTGDSITVAPIQTLTDKEYQRMRDGAIAVIRAVGVETGGSNIQFAINPEDGDMIVVEMNPRVSRSSALASKATGFPIAKIAAKLAVGYTLDELPNDITRKTVACFEPTIDYCVVKIPRWTFEKFPDADETLTTQMKSVGEAMAIGRTFKEALQKGIRSMEVKRFGLGLDRNDKWLKAQRNPRAAAPKIPAAIPGVLPPTARADHADHTSDHEHEGHDKAAQGQVQKSPWPIPEEKLRRKLAVPSQGRLYYVRYAMKMGWTIDQIYELTKIDRWFLAQMRQLVEFENRILQPEVCDAAAKLALDSEADLALVQLVAPVLRQAKQWGYSDFQLATAWNLTWQTTRKLRKRLEILPVYKLVDTCAAEFEAATPYYYSSYEIPYRQLGTGHSTSSAELSTDDEIRLSPKPKVVIIGGGPNRIGQGIEFDYCCVQAAFAMAELNLESVMVNSNPETVSTDYDTSDLLFFEPLTHEDILNICERLNGRPFSQPGGYLKGVIVQFGGQTPLNLAKGLKDAGVPILGTTVESIDAAGDREQFRTLLQKLNLRQPENGIARSVAEAREVARRIGYPVLVRPSFVLGGRAMEVVSDEAQLNIYMANAVEAAGTGADARAESPILIDRFLDNATEVDVDCIADYDPTGKSSHGRAIVIGVMEHIEEAGIHSGDSACALPPYSLPRKIVEQLKEQTVALAKALRVCGLMNVQYAIRDGEIYIIEVNPRASRTVPFVGKATGMPWAKVAAKVMAGVTLDEMNLHELPDPQYTSVKEVVFPFSKFPGVDVILGPEMRSTGEVMGIDQNFPIAYAKSQIASGSVLPTSGNVFITVHDRDKAHIVPIARMLIDLGFNLIATSGTHAELTRNGVPATRINKLREGRPNIKDFIKNGQIQLIINTPTKKGPQTDEGKIRAMAVVYRVPMITTLTGAQATARAIQALKASSWDVQPLQERCHVRK
ncbi:MAG TPA: carbamoyl-phosphate synthase large subunit [Tepidisphaeraceae bacterium]|nr:carbamoyl-phosphate synthase large subunit [Tepidisphaeraceae bacterium]